MPIQITATVDLATVTDLLAQLLPLTIRLDAMTRDRWLRIERPTRVEVVPPVGLRIRTEVSGRYSIPFTFRALQIMLQPLVPHGGGKLVFRAAVEKAEMKWFPGSDRMVKTMMTLIDQAIADRLTWNFRKLFTHDFRMPAVFEPRSTLEMRASGTVRVVPAGLELSVAIPLAFTHRAKEPAGKQGK